MNLQFRQQRTIRKSTKVSGFGYWSGLDVEVEFRPASVDSGIRFFRSDLAGQPEIAARVFNRVDAIRRTSLASKNACVELVEHIMAALAGLKIDNCDIWVNRGEMPGCDGSSLAFIEKLNEAGILEQNAINPIIVVEKPIKVSYGNSWISAEPNDHSALSVSYELDYKIGSIGRQFFQLDVTEESFQSELAAARTFVLKEEADKLHAQGLAKHVTYKDVLVFDENGPIENQLRFEDECVRHKTLDVVGDLAICGCDIVGKITAYRSGHALNGKLVQELITNCQIVSPEKRAA